jgi:hypothetical protein
MNKFSKLTFEKILFLFLHLKTQSEESQYNFKKSKFSYISKGCVLKNSKFLWGMEF